jgi:hypothetical protein
MEEFSVKQANHILCASEDVCEILREKYPAYKEKFQLVINGFDPDEIYTSDGEASGLPERKKIVITNIGTINCSREYYDHFIEALVKMKHAAPELYKKLQFNFYGNTNTQFENDVRTSGLEIFTFHPKVDSNKVQLILHNSHMALYIKREEELTNSFASKFFEYLCARKYMIVLSPEGKVTNYVRENGIGLVLTKQTIFEDLKDLFYNFSSGKVQVNTALDISEFGYDKISEKINSLLS